MITNRQLNRVTSLPLTILSITSIIAGAIFLVIFMIIVGCCFPNRRAIIHVEDHKVYCYSFSEWYCGVTLRQCDDGIDRLCVTNVEFEEYEERK